MTPRVEVATTGGDAELLETIPITRRAGEERRVAMCLGRGGGPFTSMPELRPGDLLEVTAELEVTTDARPWQGGAVGEPYRYDPVVEARLLLAGDPEAAAEDGRRALALAEPKRQTCTHRRHHRVLVFADAGLGVPDQGLPWGGPSYVNLALSAHHFDADGGQVLLVGENEPGGGVLGDKGRINVVRRRGLGRRPDPEPPAPARVTEIPVRKHARSVVYSQPLDDLVEGEQLAVHATLHTSAAHLGYPARISTRLLLADDPGQADPGGEARAAAALRGVITELNGFNCLPEESPCTTRKVGIAALRAMPGRTLYVNLVAVSADPFGGARRGDALEVLGGGGIEVVRYPPSPSG